MKTQKVLVAIAVSIAVYVSGCKKKDNSTIAADQEFMKQAAYGNMDEIDAGQLASTKGNDMAVTMFGQMMVTDHTTAMADLQTMASSKNVILPTGPDSAHIAMKAMLSAMSGRTFDSTYMHAQVTDHQNTITLMQNEINSGEDNDAKNYATKYLPIVQMHKQKADSIVAALHF